MSNPKIALEYFAEIAKRLGAKKTGEDAQANHSVYFAYQYYLKQSRKDEDLTFLNDITRALLGDDEALEALDWDEQIDIDIDDYLVSNNPEERPNEAQCEAIKKALSNPVSFIQGPPGTGKSKTILNIISCIINGLNKNVVMVSTNNEAVRVIVDAIKNGTGNANLESLKNLLAVLGNQKNVRDFTASHPEYKNRMKFEDDDRVLGTKIVTGIGLQEFTRDYKLVTSTIHSVKKLFSDALETQYDYCIMDESSQVNTMLGLLAATSAKHLVIVGDEEQLPPIVQEEKIYEANRDYAQRDVTDYIIVDDKFGSTPSIIDLCKRRFKNRENQTLLNKHYRCHKGIIEFSNRNIYGSNLIPLANIEEMAKPSQYAVPIRVKWYDGNYCESARVYSDPREKRIENLCEGIIPGHYTSKINRKQVEVFVGEELGGLIKKMDDREDGLSRFCLLSPFKAQLAELEKKINDKLQALGRDDIFVELKGSDREENDTTLPMLSVHKSQGKEYDVVYFLPVEDGNWEKPWSQNKRLINVAVSRAKKELHIIVSTSLMSPLMQKALTGKYVEPNRLDIERESHFENKRFVRKLIDYVHIANMTEEEYLQNMNDWDPEGVYAGMNLSGRRFAFPESEDEYGFHKSNIVSVFDVLPYNRQWITDDREANRTPQSIIKRCFLSGIDFPECRGGNWKIHENVPIKDILDENGNQILSSEKIQSMANQKRREVGLREKKYPKQEDRLYHMHFDFVLTDENNRCILLLEVDGEYHRFTRLPSKSDFETEDLYQKACVEALLDEEDSKLRDDLKDEIAKEYFGMHLLRLATDGSCFNEVKTIRDAITENKKSGRKIIFISQNADNP